MKVLLAALLLIYMQPTSVSAFDFACSDYRPLLRKDEIKRPEPPYCASMGFQFADEYDFERCRTEMEDYRRKIAGYSDCLASERKQAIEQFNETVESFNRKASN